MNERACKSDDCDQNHCPKCGSHTLGYLEPFQRCSTCQLEEAQRESDDTPLAAEIEGDNLAAMYDNDPNPYEGTYSEE